MISNVLGNFGYGLLPETRYLVVVHFIAFLREPGIFNHTVELCYFTYLGNCGHSNHKTKIIFKLFDFIQMLEAEEN